ncbi:hypothetical protein ACTFIR_009807 [Dictyostelium discoideum]
MTTTFGTEDLSNNMKIFSIIKKKNNSDNAYTKVIVKKDKINGIPQTKLIKYDGFTFVDISNIKSVTSQLEYIEKNKQLEDQYDGFVLEKHVKMDTYINGDYLKQAYLFNGLIIIHKLKESNIHGSVVSTLNFMIQQYGLNNGRVVSCVGSASITINQNTCQQPDGQLFRARQPPLIPTPYKILAIEVNYKALPPPRAIVKILRYFVIPTINVLFLFQIFDRDPVTDNFKVVVKVYERNISIVNPSQIISFGTEPLSQNDIDYFNQLTNNTPITGYLYNNNNINNNPINPMFIVSINPQSLFFNSPIPVGVGALEINLFEVKEEMELIPNFSAEF